MTEELEITEEMKDLMEEFMVCEECRDVAVRSLFKSKRAIKYGKQAFKAKRKFWDLVYELYPEVKEGEWYYNYRDQIIRSGSAK